MGAFATIIHREGAQTQFRVEVEKVTRAERTMPVECGRAFVRNGLPHLLLAQLDPFVDGRISRALLVRYDTERFKERAVANEDFRQRIDQILGPRRGAPGYFSSVLQKAEESASTRDIPSALLDADLEAMAVSGGRGAIIFMNGSALEQHRALEDGGNRIWFHAELEATLPSRVLADLLLSWKEAAESL